MPTISRALLIRLMLWALGATAVAGALTVLLLKEFEFAWRIVSTGLATAVFAGLMIPFAWLTDQRDSRREGVAGMALVTFQFIVSVGLIWRVFHVVGGEWLELRAAITIFMSGVTGLPAILSLWFAGRPKMQAAGYTAALIAIAVFLLVLFGVWFDSPYEEQAYGTAGVLAGLGLVIVASLPGIGTRPAELWRAVGVLFGVAALVMAVVAIWVQAKDPSFTFVFLVTTSAALGHANLALLVPLTAGQAWIRWVTIGAAVVTVGAVDVIAYIDIDNFDVPLAARVGGAAAIIACCGSLALLVLARLNQNLDFEPVIDEVLAEIEQITVVCPSCRKRHTLSIGESCCPTCRLVYHIRLEEPRCRKCSYSLYMFEGDACPECGEPVACA